MGYFVQARPRPRHLIVGGGAESRPEGRVTWRLGRPLSIGDTDVAGAVEADPIPDEILIDGTPEAEKWANRNVPVRDDGSGDSTTADCRDFEVISISSVHVVADDVGNARYLESPDPRRVDDRLPRQVAPEIGVHGRRVVGNDVQKERDCS